MPEKGTEKEKPTKEERRQKAIREGKRFETVICPLCLRARVGHVWVGDNIFKPDKDKNPEVIQVRYSLGGRGSGGFFKNEKESIRLDVLKQERPDVWKELKFEVQTVNNMFRED